MWIFHPKIGIRNRNKNQKSHENCNFSNSIQVWNTAETLTKQGRLKIGTDTDIDTEKRKNDIDTEPQTEKKRKT